MDLMQKLNSNRKFEFYPREMLMPPVNYTKKHPSMVKVAKKKSKMHHKIPDLIHSSKLWFYGLATIAIKAGSLQKCYTIINLKLQPKRDR